MKIFSRTLVKMPKHTGQHDKRNRRKKRSFRVSSRNDRGSSSSTDGLNSDLHSSPLERQLLNEVCSSSCGSIPEAVLSTDEYMMMIEHLWQVHQQEYEKYYAKLDSHPKYYAEWTHFVQRRSQSIVEFGENPMSYDFESEWKEFWSVRLRELEVQEWNEKKRSTLKFSSEYAKFQRSHKSSLSWCRKKASISPERSSISRSRSKRCKKSERHKYKRSNSREFKEFHRKESLKTIKKEKSFSHSKTCKTFVSKKSRKSGLNKSGRSRSSRSSSSTSLSFRSRSGSSSRSSSCTRRDRYKNHGKGRSRSSRSRSLSSSYDRSSFSSSNTHISLSSSNCRQRSSETSTSGCCATFRSDGSNSESKNSDRCMMQNSSGFQSESPRLSPSHHFQLRLSNCYSSNTLSCTLKGAVKCASENQHGDRSSYCISKNSSESTQKEHDKSSKRSHSKISEESKIHSRKHTKHKSKEHIPSSSKDIIVSHKKKAEGCGVKWLKSKSPSPEASLNLIIPRIKDEKEKPRNEVINGKEGSSVYNERPAFESLKHPKTVSLESKVGITGHRKDSPDTEKKSHKSRRENHDYMGSSTSMKAESPVSKCTNSVYNASSSFLKKAQTWLSALESPENCTPRVLPSSKLKSSDARDCVDHSELKKLGKDKEFTIKTDVIFGKESERIDELSGLKTNNSESEICLPLNGIKEVLANHDLFYGASKWKGISPTQSPSSSMNTPVLTKMSPKCIKLALCKETHEDTPKPSKGGFYSTSYLELIEQGTLDSKSCLDNKPGDPFIFVSPQSTCHSSSPKTNCFTQFHNSHDEKEILEHHVGSAGLSENISDGIKISSKSTDEEVQHIRFSAQHYDADVEYHTCVGHPLLKPGTRSNESDSCITNLQGLFTENIKGIMDPHDELRHKRNTDPQYLKSKKFQSINGLEDEYREVLPTTKHNLAKSSLQFDVSREAENSQVDNLKLPADRRLEAHGTLDMSEKCSFLPKVRSGKTVKTLKLLCDLGDTLGNLAPQVMSIYLMALEKEKIGQDPKDSINQADVRKIIKLIYSKLKASVDSGTIGFMKKIIRMELMEQIEDMLDIGQNLHDKTYGLDIPNLARCFLYLSRKEIVASIRDELISKGKYAPTVDIVTELYSLILDEQLKLI